VTLVVTPVASRRDRRRFHELPARLHGANPAFVPPLRAAVGAVLDRRKNPFWRHAEGAEWLALRGGRAVGRIGACDDRELAAREPGCGVVGFFECADDPEASGALFAAAEGFLRGRGLHRALGPLNYSMHDTAGVLVEGFETPPTVDTTWNPPYYDALFRRAGYVPVKDLLGAAGRVKIGGPERVRDLAAIALKRGVTVRPIDFSRFDEEVERIRLVYNEAWSGNWGHVPIGAEEFAYKARAMRPVADPDIIRVAERDGKVVGILFAMPDLNVAIRKSGGRLFPTGIFRLLRARRTARRTRVILLGVLPGQRLRGVEALLLADGYAAASERYPWAEASWILEDNVAMLNGLAAFDLHPYKRWRVYKREIPGTMRPASP